MTGGLSDRHRSFLGGACLLLATVLPTAVSAAPVRDAANGHYYEAVSQSQGITWDAADAAANARVFNGLQGHLATITSPNKNAFVATHLYRDSRNRPDSSLVSIPDPRDNSG